MNEAGRWAREVAVYRHARLSAMKLAGDPNEVPDKLTRNPSAQSHHTCRRPTTCRRRKSSPAPIAAWPRCAATPPRRSWKRWCRARRWRAHGSAKHPKLYQSLRERTSINSPTLRRCSPLLPEAIAYSTQWATWSARISSSARRSAARTADSARCHEATSRVPNSATRTNWSYRQATTVMALFASA